MTNWPSRDCLKRTLSSHSCPASGSPLLLSVCNSLRAKPLFSGSCIFGELVEHNKLEGLLCVSILCLIGYHVAACSNPQLNELNYCKTCCPEFSITKPWIECCLSHTDGSDSNRNPIYLLVAQRTFDTFVWEAF